MAALGREEAGACRKRKAHLHTIDTHKGACAYSYAYMKVCACIHEKEGGCAYLKVHVCIHENEDTCASMNVHTFMVHE